MQRKIWLGLLPLCAAVAALTSPAPVGTATGCCGSGGGGKKDTKGTLCPLIKTGYNGTYWTSKAEICKGTYTQYDSTVDCEGGGDACTADPKHCCVPRAILRGLERERKVEKHEVLQVIHKDLEEGIDRGEPIWDPTAWFPHPQSCLARPPKIVKLFTTKGD